MDKLMIIGAGGHGRVIADLAEKLNTYKEIAFLDDCAQSSAEVPVLGKVSEYSRFADEYEFVVGIGNNAVRRKLVETLFEKVQLVSLVHERAVLAKNVKIGKGVVVFANAVLNVGAELGDGVIVNTAAVVEHDCKIGAFAHVCPRAVLAGSVEVGENTFIGVGSSVANNVRICSDVILGAGSVVVKNITEAGTYVGVPIRKVIK